MPPDVGYAETSSDIVSPMIKMNTEMIGHPQEMATGPPLFRAAIGMPLQDVTGWLAR